ncbi:hypothetical protein BN14_01616 [Rhizoctonia solani AG-1 IB]|uniref:Uncharacterized protein n=1 Tax=Thanatephorus cucumeris (strain AG1-IB / isolate 7/3/14) TaxID=1108050 RepID=M5BLI4_THACB|nr:hypothetical protein BN14_01616 [Rhizoctonia solani AG-1 IB]
MSIRWNDLVPSYLTGGKYLDETKYEYFIEHDGIGAHSLQALASDILDMTPKQERDLPQAYGHVKYDSTTPPLSPSTTISSLPTEEQYSSDEPELLVSREEVKKGKQPETPVTEAIQLEEYAQDDSDWYGMEYAIEQSRYGYPGATGAWPPSAGESSTSDAAFVAMYDGYIYPEDVTYWYEHWCKWHRTLAREEKRRRDRAASDAKHTRAYDHATYVQWERSQQKKSGWFETNDRYSSPFVNLPVLIKPGLSVQPDV